MHRHFHLDVADTFADELVELLRVFWRAGLSPSARCVAALGDNGLAPPRDRPSFFFPTAHLCSDELYRLLDPLDSRLDFFALLNLHGQTFDHSFHGLHGVLLQ